METTLVVVNVAQLVMLVILAVGVFLFWRAGG